MATDWILVKQIISIGIIILVPVLGKVLPGWRKKLEDLSVAFGDMSHSWKDPSQTEVDFDKCYKDFELVLADPPGKTLTWDDVLKIDWGPGGLLKQLKGTAFVVLYVLLALLGGILAVLELATRFL
jgi:hypothetical protein